jgi:methanogenic corrinoid protein MtbC1
MFSAVIIIQAGLAVLKSYLGEGVEGSAGKVVIGTVKGDLHDIGRNLVVKMLERAGYQGLHPADWGRRPSPDASRAVALARSLVVN